MKRQEKRILWVDDEVDQLTPHILFLKEKGYSVETATNGEDAISMVATKHFDLVLLDQMMAGLDGLSTLEQIKKLDMNLPIVMITKVDEEYLMEEAIGSVVADFLIKPVNPSQILITCKKIFDKARILEDRTAREYAVEYQSVSSRISSNMTPDDWLEVALWLARWDVTLDNFPELGLTEAHRDFRRDCNAEFGRFVERHYPSWVTGTDKPTLSTDIFRKYVVPELKTKGTKLFYIVVDCMRLDQWLLVLPLVEKDFDVRTDVYYSILPTATPFARNSLFAGLFPLDIQRIYPELWGRSAVDTMSQNRYEHQLMDKLIQREGVKLSSSTKYVKILDPDEGDKVIRHFQSYLAPDLSAMVINFLDILTHGRAESDILKEISPDERAFRAVMKTWFLHSSLYEALQLLAKSNHTVIVTTDHGSMIGRRGTKVFGKKDASTTLRYKFGDNLNGDPRHTVIINNPAEYKLPSITVSTNYIIAKEDYFLVYPTNYNIYEKQYTNSILHGGISLEEMVVPVSVLRPKER